MRPITNRVANGEANVSLGRANTRYDEETCLLLGDSPPVGRGQFLRAYARRCKI